MSCFPTMRLHHGWALRKHSGLSFAFGTARLPMLQRALLEGKGRSPMHPLTPCLALLALFLVSCASPPPQVTGVPASVNGPFRLGDDVLASNGWDLLRGRRVGLISNQTSVN